MPGCDVLELSMDVDETCRLSEGGLASDQTKPLQHKTPQPNASKGRGHHYQRQQGN